MSARKTQSKENVAELVAGTMHYRELNQKIVEFVNSGAEVIRVRDVVGQRYIGAGLSGNVRIEIYGTPGNDLACFMAGPEIEVYGNAQDGVANTMNAGRVIVHGDGGDVIGYSMRGGEVYIKGDVGYRVGIHMKEYKEKSPVIIVGGSAKDYFGEYMAGGTLILLGLGKEENESPVGDFLGTGMHGGRILIRGEVDKYQMGKEIGEVGIKENDWERIKPYIDNFQTMFDINLGNLTPDDFTHLLPVTHRPYGKIYVY